MNIYSFTDTVYAGLYYPLTTSNKWKMVIKGINFGDNKGSVYFVNADNVESPNPFVPLNTYDILEWNNSEITIRMPSIIVTQIQPLFKAVTPGSGVFYIKKDTVDSVISSTPVIIPYAINNAYIGALPDSSKKVRMDLAARNNSGEIVFYAGSSILNSGIPNILPAIQAALSHWQCYSHVKLRLSTDSVNVDTSGNGLSVIHLTNHFSQQNTLARTSTSSCTNAPDAFHFFVFSKETDIAIRSNLPSGCSWVCDTTGADIEVNKYDFFDVILHELGHALLLKHMIVTPPGSNSAELMYYLSPPSPIIGIYRRGISGRDVNGVLDIVRKSLMDTLNPNSCNQNILVWIPTGCSNMSDANDIVKIGNEYQPTWNPVLIAPDQNVTYSAQYWDNEPYSTYNYFFWRFELFHADGIFTYKQFDPYFNMNRFDFSVNADLPFYDWVRDANGNIMGQVKVFVSDDEGYVVSDSLSVSLLYPTAAPLISVSNATCSAASLNFYARGATGYKIYYATSLGGPYNGQGLSIGNSPVTVGNINTLNITGLNQIYYFKIEAINSTGSSSFSQVVCNSFGDVEQYTASVGGTWMPGTGSNPFGSATGTVYIDKTLTIPAGKTVTIKNMTLKFGPLGKVVLEASTHYGVKGGKLILDNTRLTSCDRCAYSDFWSGVEVHGLSGYSQFPSYSNRQGCLEIKNHSIIENARTGVLVGSEMPGSGGGILHASSHSKFRNNIRAVEFAPYHNRYDTLLLNNNSSIDLCTFETDGAMLNGAYPFAFVRLYGTDGITFRGDTFINRTPELYPFNNRGYGIFSGASKFYVNSYCSYSPEYGHPCMGETKGRFENLTCAIRNFNYDIPQPAQISNNEFINNFHAVNARYADNLKITDNTFDIADPQDMYPPWSPGDIDDNYVAYGVYLDRCNGFKVEENTFKPHLYHGALRTVDPHFQYPKVGIVVGNSCYYGNNNSIYNNNYDSLSIGTCAMGYNGGQSGGVPFGLQFQCGKYTKDEYDITVQTGTIISPAQGSAQIPEVNDFSDECWSNNNLWDGSLWYYHYTAAGSNNPVYSPVCRTPDVSLQSSGLVFPGWDQVCPSHLTAQLLPSGIISGLTSLNDSILVNTAVYNQTVDGGKTKQLLKAITQSNHPDNLRKKLLQHSPYLSEDVMLELVKRDDCSPQVVTDVLVANPQSAVSQPILQQLSLRENPLTPAMLQQVNEGTNRPAPLAAIQSLITTDMSKRDYLFNELISYYLNDTVHDNTDSIIDILNNYPTNANKYRIIPYYLKQNNTTMARTVLNSIPSSFHLQGDDLVAYQKYTALFTILIDLQEQGKTVYDMNPHQLQTIHDLAANDKYYAEGLARSVLQEVENVHYPNYVFLPTTKTLNGYLFESDLCGGLPVINDTIIIISENGDSISMQPPVVTDMNGAFSFEQSQLQALDNDLTYRIATKSGFTIDSISYLSIQDWFAASPLQLTLSDAHIEWTDFYSGVDSLYNGGNAIDLQGNVYVAGYTGSSTNGRDYLVIKYSPSGQRLWTRTYNGIANGDDIANDIVVDGENNCYVVGSSTGANAEYDIVTLKYSSSGQLIWEKRYSGAAGGADGGKAIALDVSNNAYIAGHTYIGSGFDIVTLKYNKNGVLQWSKIYNNADNEFVSDLKVDLSGNPVVAGYNVDYITLKYSPNGGLIWAKQFNSGAKRRSDFHCN